MNKVEQFVYGVVRKNPRLKQIIRDLYQSLFDLLPRPSEIKDNIISLKEGYFFGFHDLNPLSENRDKLLANKYPFDLKMPAPYEKMEVGYLHYNNGILGDFVKIGETRAWNYHKGCRLQWLNNSEIIYNDYVSEKVVSKIINVNNYSERILNFPIDSIYCDSQKCIASSFSYERLQRCMPGYGYPYKDMSFLDDSAPSSTGLFLNDIKRDSSELLISLKEIAEKVHGAIDPNYLHFVTHTEFSKDGNFLAFLYRLTPKKQSMKILTSICVYDLINRQLLVLPSQGSGSHYVWNNKNQILASCIIEGKSCHVIFDIPSLTYKIIAKDILNSDGHQSFINDSEFITDTYPDKYRLATIFKCNMPPEQVSIILRVKSPKQFQTVHPNCHIACDLHPRVIDDGKFVCFDTVRTNKRAIAIASL